MRPVGGIWVFLGTPDAPAQTAPLRQPPSSPTLLASRCNAIEEAYEFMLAYAAQGLPSEQGSAAGSQIRDFLSKCDAAMSGLADAITVCVERLGLEPPDRTTRSSA